jgi:hypothetical protein
MQSKKISVNIQFTYMLDDDNSILHQVIIQNEIVPDSIMLQTMRELIQIYSNKLIKDQDELDEQICDDLLSAQIELDKTLLETILKN